MFNGSLIEDLFAVVKQAEDSARPGLPEQTQSREIDAEPLNDFDERREANSEAE